MSQCIVPNWNVRQDQHDEAEEEEEGKRSSQVNKRFRNPPVPMSGHGVAELIWENGHFNMQGLGGLAPSFPTKTTWPLADDTLESLVHQAAHCKRNPNHTHDVHSNIQQQPNNIDSVVASSAGGKWPPKPISTKVPTGSDTSHKRPRPDPAPPRKQSSCSYTLHGHTTNNSVGTASFRDTDTTMMTWASFESPGSFKTKTTDDDSACHNVTDNLDEEVDKKTETVRSHSTTRSRAAAVHNQSERKRRDRINQKMKTLQKLVPNASKTDKASMLDEVIEYTKQLQAQLDMMSSRTMPHMLMPMGMQHLHMPLLARMGLAMGMGMRMLDSITPPSPANPPILHPTNASQIPPQAFVPAVPPPFMQLPDHLLPPHLSPPAKPDQHRQPRQIPLSDPYSAYLAQAMNMDLYNKMAAFYQQQAGHMAKNMPANSKHPESSVK